MHTSQRADQVLEGTVRQRTSNIGHSWAQNVSGYVQALIVHFTRIHSYSPLQNPGEAPPLRSPISCSGATPILAASVRTALASSTAALTTCIASML